MLMRVKTNFDGKFLFMQLISPLVKGIFKQYEQSQFFVLLLIKLIKFNSIWVGC
jgi:hypothetical protein